MEKTESRNLRRLREDPRLVGDSWEYFNNWLAKLSPDTREGYLREFNQWLEFRDQDTEEFFSQYLEWVGDSDPRKKKRMGIELVNYQKQVMEDRGIKGGSVINIYRAVKGFFTANELPFELNGDKVKDDSDQLPNISKNQLNQILDVIGTHRIKAVIHFAKESGLRLGDITNLTIGDVRPVWDDPDYNLVKAVLEEENKLRDLNEDELTKLEDYRGFYTFTIEQGKTENNADPCIGPECIEALQLWKRERRDRGISDNDDDPLFCAVKNRKEWTTRAGTYHKGSTAGDPLNESTLGVIFGQYVRKSNVEPLRGEKRKPSIHSLRKYHKTNLEYSGVPTSWVNVLQGRAGEGTGGVYTKPDTYQLIDIYSRGYYALSLKEESHVNGFRDELEGLREDQGNTGEYIKIVEKENVDLKARLEKLEKRMERIAEGMGI